MTHDPMRPSTPDAMPPVDQVIHDIRESSGTLRAPDAREVSEASAGTPHPDALPEASSPHRSEPARTAAGDTAVADTAVADTAVADTAVAGASPGTGHEASGHAPGHQRATASADAAAAHDAHGEAHAPGEDLGPIDTANWGAGIVGVSIGLGIAACFALAAQGLGAY